MWSSAPDPGGLVAQSLPACSLTMPAQIESPSPVPPAAVLVRLDWTNLSNTFSSSSSGMPGPSSRTTISTVSSRRIHEHPHDAVRRREAEGVAHQVPDDLLPARCVDLGREVLTHELPHEADVLVGEAPGELGHDGVRELP